MAGNRSDFIAPIALAAFAYLAAMILKGLQGLVDQSSIINQSTRALNLNHTIIDDFIHDKDILHKLQDAQIWEECDKADARWYDHKNSEPQNIWEEISKKIWQDRPEFESALGFEYWCNIVSETRELIWHIDKGENHHHVLNGDRMFHILVILFRHGHYFW
jgi:hypothetical protein